MTENMKRFLKAVSENDECFGRIKEASKDDLFAMAGELGVELTEADFAEAAAELSDDELNAVAGGGECICAVNGGGEANSIKEKMCLCVLGGGGEYSNLGDGGCRCVCVLGGYGESGCD